jgi:hypothetical protein
MIEIFATVMHWCVSCVNNGNVIPGAAGIAGGALGAAGGLGELTGAGGGGDAGAGDAGETDLDLERELDRRYPPPLVARVLPPRGPTTGPPVELGGPRTFEEAASIVGFAEGLEGLDEGLPLEKVVDDAIKHKTAEEGLKVVGEGFQQLVEDAPPELPWIDGGPVSGTNPDGSPPTANADGSWATPNAGASVDNAPTSSIDPVTSSSEPSDAVTSSSEPDGS